MILPPQLAAAGSERAHQTALFAALALDSQRIVVTNLSESMLLYLIHAIPNGGERHPRVAAAMKAEGVRAGVWDVFVPVARGGYIGLYIEMKAPTRRKNKNGGLTDDQVKFGLAVHGQGYLTKVCYTWQEALDVVRSYFGYEGPDYDREFKAIRAVK